MKLIILLVIPSQFALLRIGTGSSAVQLSSQIPGKKWVELGHFKVLVLGNSCRATEVLCGPHIIKVKEKKIKGKINLKFMF